MAPLTLTTTPILVVGGCGFLGHHIVRLLLDRYPTGTFHVLDLNTSLNRFPNVTYHSADITSVPAVRAIFEEVKPGVIINTVSPVTGLGKQIYFKVNVEGNKVLLEEAKRVGVKAFVFTSSASVVFNGEFEVRNGDESLPYADPPMDAYNESKALAEKHLLSQNDPSGTKTIALRVAGLFGPGDRQLMPGAMSVLRDGKTHFQIGDNENLFDMTYIENAAHAHILAAIKLLEQPTTPKTAEVGRVDGEAFFITNGEPVYFWDFMRAIWRRYQNPPNDKFTIMPAGFGMVIGTLAEAASWITGKEPTFSRFRVRFTTMNRYFNIKKARVYLDYEPIVSLEEGLRRACDAWDEQEREKSEKKGQ